MQEIAGNTENTAATASRAQQDASDSATRVRGNISALQLMAEKARETAGVVDQLRCESGQHRHHAGCDQGYCRADQPAWR